MRPKSELVANYRKAYVAIKTYPFIYTAAMLALCPFEAWLPLPWAEAIGLMAFTSVPSALLCWRLSRAVRLCPWHRAQCLVMLLPVSIPLCRIFCPGLGVAWLWGGVTAVLIASLVNCYKTFIEPTTMVARRKRDNAI